jgi:hypothetical protein
MKLKIFLIFKFTKSMINNKGKRHKKNLKKRVLFIYVSLFYLDAQNLAGPGTSNHLAASSVG